MRKEDKLYQFLMGFDETLYRAMKSSILSPVPLPTLKEAYTVFWFKMKNQNLSRRNEEREDIVSFVDRLVLRLEDIGDALPCTTPIK